MYSYHVTRTTNKTNRFYILLHSLERAKKGCAINIKLSLFFCRQNLKKGRKSLCAAEKKRSTAHQTSPPLFGLSVPPSSRYLFFFLPFATERESQSARARERERSEKENEFGYIIHFSRRREEEEQVKKKSRRKTRSFER